MSVLFAHRSRRRISIFATTMLLAATLVTLMHWHQDSIDQRCEVCFARSLPSVLPFTACFTTAIRIEWQLPIDKPIKLQAASFEFDASRAPPRLLFL